jgi:hypothetical protein
MFENSKRAKQEGRIPLRRWPAEVLLPFLTKGSESFIPRANSSGKCHPGAFAPPDPQIGDFPRIASAGRRCNSILCEFFAILHFYPGINRFPAADALHLHRPALKQRLANSV